MDTPYKVGTIWDTKSRKGALTIQLTEDVDMTAEDFFGGLIIEGRAQYAAVENRIAQREEGMGTRGDTISFRTTLTTFLRRREDLERRVADERTKWATSRTPPQG